MINLWVAGFIIGSFLVLTKAIWIKICLLIGIIVLSVVCRQKTGLYCCLLIGIIFLQTIKAPLARPTTNYGRIVSVSDQTVTVQTDQQKVLVRNVKDPCIYCFIEFSGEYQEIEYVKTTYGNDWKQYYRNLGIKYVINPKAYTIRPSNHWRTKLDLMIGRIENDAVKTHIRKSMMPYKIDTLADPFLNSAFYSRGLLIGWLITRVKNFLRLFFKPKTVKRCSMVILVVLSYFYLTWVVLLRTFLSQILSKQKVLPIVQWCQLWLIMLCCHPGYLTDLSFLIPMSFRLVSIFSQRKCWYQSMLAIIPINLRMFNRFDMLSSLLYPLIRWLGGINVILIVLSLITNWFSPVFWLLDLLQMIQLPSITITGHPAWWWLLCWYQLVSLLLLYRQKRYGVYLLLLLAMNQYQVLFYPFDTVTYLYIGQGDSTIIHRAFRKDVMMIDTGSSYNFNYLKNYLDGKGIKTIDTLVITHSDSDHNGNVEALLQQYRVNRIIEQKQSFSYYDRPITALLSQQQYDNNNDNSLVYWLGLHQSGYLFLGDISHYVEQAVAQEVTDVDLSIVKVAHHGSNTSTSETLYQHPKIKVAIISCGLNNRYGHPHQTVLQRLRDYQILTLRTDQEGDITSVDHPFFHFIYTSRGKLYLF